MTKSGSIDNLSAKGGQKIRRAYPRDNSSYQAGSKAEQKIGKLEGSDSNLSHSITGSSVASGPGSRK